MLKSERRAARAWTRKAKQPNGRRALVLLETAILKRAMQAARGRREQERGA
jgi:hypothetical protein